MRFFITAKQLDKLKKEAANTERWDLVREFEFFCQPPPDFDKLDKVQLYRTEGSLSLSQFKAIVRHRANRSGVYD